MTFSEAVLLISVILALVQIIIDIIKLVKEK